MTDETRLNVAETMPAQQPPKPAPSVGMSFLAPFRALRAIFRKYPALKPPYRTAPRKQEERDEQVWSEIDRTAPSRDDLHRLLKHFRSQ